MLEKTFADTMKSPSNNPGLRILFVEDNPEDAELAEHVLRGAVIDFTSRRVETRDEYMDALREFTPDLIISDYDLPQFSGTEALALSKEICADVPFILMTGAVGEERAIEILTGGATDYVMKNRLSRLVPAVDRALNEAKEHRNRKRAEAERDQLLQELEERVRQRTAELQTEIEQRRKAEKALNEHKDKLEIKVQERTALLSEANRMLLMEIAERKKTEERLRSAQKELRAMASEIVLAEERSRQHFAAELHDTVVQTLSAAKLRGQFIQDEIPASASRVFADLQEMISRSIAQSRQIMAELSPPVLNELGFVPALEWLAGQASKQHGIEIDFRAEKDMEISHQEIRIMLFQAVRELLVNIVKHSRADRAMVRITGKGRKIRIEVRDNGTGFDKRRAISPDIHNGGFGLFSIRERLKHFGGNLIIQSWEGKGTRIIITSPQERPDTNRR